MQCMANLQVCLILMLEGDLPSKAQALVKEWAAVYKTDIMNMWETKVSKKLPPLL